MFYKFTETDYDIKGSAHYKMYKYYADGGSYSKYVPEHLYYVSFREKPFSRINENLLRRGYVKVMGWVLDYRDIWNKYLVKVKYYGWQEYYAPSKMAIRDTIGSHNIIGEIIEL